MVSVATDIDYHQFTEAKRQEVEEWVNGMTTWYEWTRVYDFKVGEPFRPARFHRCGQEFVLAEALFDEGPETIVVCYGCKTVWRTEMLATVDGYAAFRRDPKLTKQGDKRVVAVAAAYAEAQERKRLKK